MRTKEDFIYDVEERAGIYESERGLSPDDAFCEGFRDTHREYVAAGLSPAKLPYASKEPCSQK